MILKTLLNVLSKTASDESVKYLGGAPTVNAKKKLAQTSHSHTYTGKESKVKKRKSGLNDTVKSFMNRSRGTLVCSVCNTTYYEGALDFLSDEIKSCPLCDNGKDEQ
jgi:rubrerythrin